MQTRSPAIALVLAMIVAVGGCQTPSTAKLRFPAEEVQRLDGLRAGQEVELATTSGDVVEVTTRMTLRFAGPGVPERKLRCDQIDIAGSLLTCVGRTGAAEHLDLRTTPEAYVLIRTSRRSWRKTGLVILGAYIVIGLFAAIGSAA